MILAAAKDSWVRPITHSTPQPIIPIVRKSVMPSIIEWLKQHHINDIRPNAANAERYKAMTFYNMLPQQENKLSKAAAD